MQEVGEVTAEEVLKRVPGFICGIMPQLLAMYNAGSSYVRFKSL